MTKAFLEPIVLKPENERLVLEAFSKRSLEKVKVFNAKKHVDLTKRVKRKLSISDLI